MDKNELAFYGKLLSDIKARIRLGQQRAASSANAEMILTYWDIGRMIAERQKMEGWGAAVIPRLAIDLKNDLPEEKGFSTTNLKRMLQFHREYPDLLEIGAPLVPQLESSIATPQTGKNLVAKGAPTVPFLQVRNTGGCEMLLGLSWSHNIVLMQKVKPLPARFWYANKAAQQGWGRDALIAEIKSNAFERQGAAVTNFDSTLPAIHAAIAGGLLKDPFMFDFLTLEEPFHERELETGLLTHIEKFLLELGRGFAFVGRQYEVSVSDREYYLDLLFYHLHLRCFVVVDLKKGDFKPEYAGKMNFYCSAVDDLLRHQQDAPELEELDTELKHPTNRGVTMIGELSS